MGRLRVLVQLGVAHLLVPHHLDRSRDSFHQPRPNGLPVQQHRAR